MFTLIWKGTFGLSLNTSLHIPVPAVLGFVIVTTFPVYTKRKGVDPSRSVRVSILRV